MLSEAKTKALRFFRNIPLFRRDGVADPQIPARSGDELRYAPLASVTKTNATIARLSELLADDDTKGNSEHKHASVKDTDSDIA